MRSIHTSTFEIRQADHSFFMDQGYAVLSHRWMGDEIDYQRFATYIGKLQKEKDSTNSLEPVELDKIHGACRIARFANLNWIWIDSCCIDKSSAVELSEAINSMFKWYAEASTCITYLSDVQHDNDSHGMEALCSIDYANGRSSPSVWFSRGWTLQELLAPKSNNFFDMNWAFIGTRESLIPALESITGIKKLYLTGAPSLKKASIATKMSWMAGRATTRPEDIAYSMLGLFGINMVPLYGEGAEGSFMRLQEELLRKSDDETLFAWKMPTDCRQNPSRGRQVYGNLDLADYEWGLLAQSPEWFRNSGNVTNRGSFVPRRFGGFKIHQNGIGVPFSKGVRAEAREHSERTEREWINLVVGLAGVLTIIGAPFTAKWLDRRNERYANRLVDQRIVREWPLNAWEQDKVVHLCMQIRDYGYIRVNCQDYKLSDDKPSVNQVEELVLRPKPE